MVYRRLRRQKGRYADCTEVAVIWEVASMHPTIWATVLCFTIMVTILALGERFRYLKQCYYLGINTWAQWLPVLSMVVFELILLAGLLGRVPFGSPELSVVHSLSKPEVLVLALIGPLFLTSAGNALGMATTLHLIARVGLTSGANGPALGIMTLLVCSTFIMILSDKIPWSRQQGFNPMATKIREIVSLIISFGSL